MKNNSWMITAFALFAVFAAGLAGCQETRPDRDYVQANIYEKDVFQGDWFYVRTVVDHDYESSWMGYYGTFTGDQTWSTEVGAMERITWIIDENYLYAYRTVPIWDGANSDQDDPSFREDPVASFRITKHFDIMKRYNPETGEELNVIEENDTERSWYERRYMRVDWSQNLLIGYYWNSLDAYEAFGYVTREPIPFYCGEGSDLGFEIEGSCSDGIDNDHDGTCDTNGCEVRYIADGEEKTRDLPPDPVCVADPDASEIKVASVCDPSFLPVVRYTSQQFDDAYGTYFNKELSEEDMQEGTPYYFSFVTQEMWTPNTEWIWTEAGLGNFPISSVKISVRNSFLKSTEVSHYEALNVVDEMWDRFGIIRMAKDVYLGSEGTTDYEPGHPKCDPESPEYYPDNPKCDPERPEYYPGNPKCDPERPAYDPDNPQCDPESPEYYPGNPKCDPERPEYYPGNPKCDPESTGYDPLYEGCDPDSIIHEDRGLVDFKNYWGARHNIWVDYRDAEGNDIPHAERELRHIVYYLNEGFPKWLIGPAFEVVAEWNEAFMQAVDLARTGEIHGDYSCTLNYGGAMPENAGRFSDYDGVAVDPDSTPRFEGEDCVMVLRVNSNDLGEGEYADAVGTRVIARYDDSRRIDPLGSNVEPNGEKMGDLRFKFLSVIDVPGARFGGVSLPLQDPRNGELIQSNCNVTRESYESVITSAITRLGLFADLCQDDTIDFHDSGVNQTYTNVCNYLRDEFNTIDLPDYIEGDYIREYFANLGLVESAPTPIVPEALSGLPSPVSGGGSFTSVLSRLWRDQLEVRMEGKMHELAGPDARAKLFGDRITRLKGTEWEKIIYDNPESYLLMHHDGAAGPIIDPSAPVTEDMLDTFSVMRKSFVDQKYASKKQMMRMMNHFMEPTSPFMDYPYMEVAKEYMDKGYNASQLALAIGQRYFKNVMLHEMGHSIGMEHNFAGSIDKNNYHDEYFKIVNLDECMQLDCIQGETSPEREAANCWPCPDTVSFDDNDLTVDQTAEWTKAVKRMEAKRDMLGIHRWQTTSIMDYLPMVYDDFGGLGKYDKAFPLFAYAGKVETYNGDPRVQKNKFVLDPVRGGTSIPKVYWNYYLGGERCEDNTDCPYHSESGLLPDSQVSAKVTQRCVEHPYYDTLPKSCSNYFDDAQKLIDAAGIGTMDYFPVIYRFCSNNRTYDISWCNMFDAGGSYREVLNNLRELYHKDYPYSHFRRYKRSYYGGVYWFLYEIMGKINQHFYYRYIYEPGFLNVEGPLGFFDMYYSVFDSLNFFGEVLATPDVGSYAYDPNDNTYYKVSNELGLGEMDIPLGMGKYMWSSFQDGQLGIFRLERQGVHLDKLYTLLALVLREWGTSYFYDERFWFNYYDLFPNETLELIGSYILDDPHYYGAREVDGHIFYPQVYSPSVCNDWRSNLWEDCNPSRVDEYFPRPWEEMEDIPTISDGSNEILRNYALIMSLAELPFFTDPTYERQMFICEKGSGYCFDICEQDEIDGGTAHYFCNDPEVTPLVADEDFIEYTSDRLHKTFISVQVEKVRPFDVKQIDIAMDILRKARSLQENYYELQDHRAAGTCPVGFPSPCDTELANAIDRVGTKLVETESFIVNIINIQRQYGISSWLI